MHKPPVFITKIIKSINSLGYDAFLVGGWVRNAYLGLESSDFDICTNADLDSLSELFASYKLKKHATQFGGLSFNIESASVEITRYRKETGYYDGRHPDTVEFVADLNTDLMRRDFTVNTLCYHPETGLLDPLGSLPDLESGVLRMVGDPYQRLGDDVLRIVRLFRLCAEYGFSIESETLSAALSLMSRLEILKVSDWKAEVFKLIQAPGYYELCLNYPTLLGTLITPLGQAIDFDQQNPYHRYSLYEHSLRVSACLPNTVGFRLVGLFHDLGKLNTQELDDAGIGHYRGHAEASVGIAKPYFEAFQFKKTETEWMLNLIQLHDYKLKETKDSLYGFAYQHSLAFTRDLIVLKRCDNRAKSDLALYQVTRCDVFTQILDEIADYPLVISDLKIKNEDVLALGVAQKDVGTVLRQVLETVVVDAVGNDASKQYDILKRSLNHELYTIK